MVGGPGSATHGQAPTPAARVAWTALFALALGWLTWAAASTLWHCDDAYISFRYVWHLLQGNGLVFNAGERVEGYTNLAWVLELALVQKLTGVPPEVSCDVLSGLCTLGSVACLLLLAREAPLGERRAPAALGALLLLAVSHTWAVWSTSGLETRQFTLCILAGALLLHLAMRAPQSPAFRRRLVLSALAFAMTELTRPEGGLMGACAGAWLLLEMWITRRWSFRAVLSFAGPLLLVIVGHYLWRHAYYGDWLPNTYYAKVVRSWPKAGMAYYVAALIETGAWFLIPFALVGTVARVRRGDRLFVLAAFLILPHVVYLVFVGGDHFEWRPLDYYWPFLALAAAEGMLATASALGARLRTSHAGLGPWVERASFVLLVALACVYHSAVQNAKLAYTMRFETRAETAGLDVDLTRENSPALFRVPGMSLLVPVYSRAYRWGLAHGVGVTWREHEQYWRAEIEKWSPLECLREPGSLPGDMVFSRAAIGIIGYVLASTTLIDANGLTDRHIAHAPTPRTNEERYMGHDRVPDENYMRARGLNVRLRPDAPDPLTALKEATYAVRVCGDVWMAFDSRDREWVTRAFRERELWGWVLERKLGTFESGDDGWSSEGTFAVGPRAGATPGRLAKWPTYGGGLRNLDSRAPDGSAAGKGRARSPGFTATASTRLSVRLAGSARKGAAGARLLCEGKVVHAFDPLEAELVPEQLDLTPFAGRPCVLEVFDDSDEAWVAVGDTVLLVPGKLDSP